MSSSNSRFLTCIQVSQEAGQVVWYSHLFQNFPQFIVIHMFKGFGIVNKAEIDVFQELSCFFDDPADVGSLMSETPVLWSPHAKSWLIGKDPDAGKDWGQEEKGMTEDEMAGWHHWLYGHEFE